MPINAKKLRDEIQEDKTTLTERIEADTAELERLDALLAALADKPKTRRKRGRRRATVTKDDVRGHVEDLRRVEPHITDDALRVRVADRVESEGKSKAGIALRLREVLGV